MSNLKFMKRNKKGATLTFEELRDQLHVLNPNESVNIWGGQSSGPTSIQDIYDKIVNGDFDNVPAGKYDFNTGTFTPYDSSMQQEDWYVVIEEVQVFGYSSPYTNHPSPPSDGTTFPGHYNEDYFYPGYGTENLQAYFGSLLGSTIGYAGGGGSGLPMPGVYHIVGHNDHTALNNLNYTPPGFPNDVYSGPEYYTFLKEHYSGQPDVFMRYVLTGDEFEQFTQKEASTINNTVFNSDYNHDLSGLSVQAVMDALNAFFDRIDQFYEDFMTAMGVVQMATTEQLAISTGQAIGKLDTTFEQTLFSKYWDGDASDYVMDESGFKRMVSKYKASDLTKYDYNTVKTLEPKLADNGDTYYFAPINGYALGSEYDYSLGIFTGIFDLTGSLVGFYDFYDFDPANREGLAEFATKTINAISHPLVAEFHVFGGNYPSGNI